MVAALTTADLLSRVRVQCMLPPAAAEGRISSQEILDEASSVLRTTCADLLIGTRAAHWVLLAADVSIVSGTYLYAVPERALAVGVADILVTDGTDEWSAPELTLAEAYRYRRVRGPWDSPYAYAWRDDKIELLPHPADSAYSLRVLYPIRPSRLVQTTDCASVASSTSTEITTSATVPSAWSSSETVDVVSGSTGRPRGTDLAGTSIATTNVTLTTPSGTAAGDFVALAGETCVPPIPELLFDVLVAGTTLEILRDIGDGEGIQAATSRLAQESGRVQSLLSPRSRGASKKIVAHGYGTRRGRR